MKIELKKKRHHTQHTFIHSSEREKLTIYTMCNKEGRHGAGDEKVHFYSTSMLSIYLCENGCG